MDVYPLMQEYSPAYYQQFLARDVAYCLIWHSFGGITAFWSDGLATYLSGYVYIDTNLELEDLPDKLEETELHSPLQSRAFTNWVFFEYLHKSIGAKGNLELVGGLAEGGLGPLTARWHSFNEKLTDADVADQGGGFVPYSPPFEDVQVTGPIVMPPMPDPIGVARAQLTVPTGQVACVSYETNGAATVSWRSGVPGTTGGSWSTDLPDELTDISVFLVTTSDAGQLTMTVEKVVDQEDGCEKDVIDLDDSSDCLTLQCGPSGYYFEVSED